MPPSTTTTAVCLLGKTGAGKSATGNAILGRNVFHSGPGTTSLTTEVTAHSAEVGGREVTVVDGPGVGDTRLTREEDVQASIKSLEQVISTTPGGYHALLLTFRYGTRYTEEDRNVLAALKTLLGPEFVRKHAVLVVTCGDVLEQDMVREEEGEGQVQGLSVPCYFSRWLDDQTGDLAELLKELEGRVVLFNNKTKDESMLEAQREELFKTVDNLSNRGLRYSQEDFLASALSRQAALVETRREKVQAETKGQLDAISSKLAETLAKPQASVEDVTIKISTIGNLQSLVESIGKAVESEDGGTGAIKSLLDMVGAQRNSIQAALQGVKALLEQMKQQEREAEEMRRQQEELQRQQEEQRRQAELRRQEEARQREERRRQEEEERQRREGEARQRELEMQRRLAEEEERRRQLEAQHPEIARQVREERERKIKLMVWRSIFGIYKGKLILK